MLYVYYDNLKYFEFKYLKFEVLLIKEFNYLNYDYQLYNILILITYKL